jgi:hypothetical protein
VLALRIESVSVVIARVGDMTGDLNPFHVIVFVVLGILILAAGIYIERVFGDLDAKAAKRRRVHKPMQKITFTETVSRPVKVAAGYERPVGTYAIWPWVAFWILLITGLIGSAYGSGGSLAGFAAAVVTNPILWACGFCWTWLGSARCPHCRATVHIDQFRNMPVGSEIQCDTCANVFLKPRA